MAKRYKTVAWRIYVTVLLAAICVMVGAGIAAGAQGASEVMLFAFVAAALILWVGP